MPKVTKEYLEIRKKFILDCAAKVIKEKPLYEMTMRDVIKETKLSQGAIYRYYSSLEEIYIEIANRNTPVGIMEKQMDEAISAEKEPKVFIMEGFKIMADYIVSLQDTMGGKMYFELLVLHAQNIKETENLIDMMNFKQSFSYIQNRFMEYILQHIEKGDFKPIIEAEKLMNFIGVAMDGILDDAAISSMNNRDMDILGLCETLGKSLIYLLNI
ncbi:TetR/AcrR family transcriptional regulator [Clostridium sp.]|uniref:TetR/AcrR family transcriptional regulator n=1 Tax=Clostridium sp. TaxID=1506 RepID=UPI00261FF168|nr:TetR/AcrR family transcriptional regulator [Clostridium sp.]